MGTHFPELDVWLSWIVPTDDKTYRWEVKTRLTESDSSECWAHSGVVGVLSTVPELLVDFGDHSEGRLLPRFLSLCEPMGRHIELGIQLPRLSELACRGRPWCC